MKNRAAGAELFIADARTARYDGGNTDFRNAAIASKNTGSHSNAVSTGIVQELKMWAVSLILNRLL